MRNTVISFWERKSVCGESICTSNVFSFPYSLPFSTSGYSYSSFYRRRLLLSFSRKNQSSLKAVSRWSFEIVGEVQLVVDENYLRVDRGTRNLENENLLKLRQNCRQAHLFPVASISNNIAVVVTTRHQSYYDVIKSEIALTQRMYI